MNKHQNDKDKYFPDLIFGGIDGIITTFAVVAGVVGANLSSIIIFILGISNLFADGFSMAVSNYLATKSGNQIDHVNFKKPLRSAYTTFFAFIIFGSIPLIPYVIEKIFNLNNFNSFNYSFIITILTFAVLGILKAEATKRDCFKSVMETVLIGVGASVIAFLIGDLLSSVII
jgi:vacuolar iron transporter family protein